MGAKAKDRFYVINGAAVQPHKARLHIFYTQGTPIKRHGVKNKARTLCGSTAQVATPSDGELVHVPVCEICQDQFDKTGDKR